MRENVFLINLYRMPDDEQLFDNPLDEEIELPPEGALDDLEDGEDLSPEGDELEGFSILGEEDEG